MWYIIIIIAAIFIINWVNKNTFHWETIVKYLWKQIFQFAEMMYSEISSGQNEILFIDRYKKNMGIRGSLINSIIDFVNYLKKQEDETSEEETFGYGRYNFEEIYNRAKSKPEAFKNLNKK